MLIIISRALTRKDIIALWGNNLRNCSFQYVTYKKHTEQRLEYVVDQKRTKTFKKSASKLLTVSRCIYGPFANYLLWLCSLCIHSSYQLHAAKQWIFKARIYIFSKLFFEGNQLFYYVQAFWWKWNNPALYTLLRNSH